ncbi:AAA family ATPase [Leifsonia shinshuensis]|uniref:RNA polymerase recycling motor ATPase HelR n=1 Tax=Leifsonia shinshuensis TaxID=150026 RepID=UPI001F5124E2|nr:RNA polymerase recycling motor ATPase HelR [Leifsonia shinshuensis]MCI0156637.1 AAA family ATPase [Leifsonia shinshuensis]
MVTATSTAFALPENLRFKGDPALIAQDEQHFAAIDETLRRTIAELSDQLTAELRAPGGHGQKALDRDTEVRRLSARLRALGRFGRDVCLGRMVPAAPDGGAASEETTYIGRFGLTDGDGRKLLVDWRSPAAEPFFGATLGDPMGLVSRRRYRWTNGRVTDYWDEAFAPDALDDAASRAALDDQSAFIASLGASRSPRMRDVLATIQADQDAIIRDRSRGALVVDGGPGTGKTVVALHRAAYLLYADPRLSRGHGGVLFVGPSPAYLAYVSDVLPSLGEEGVQLCTLRDLLAEGATAGTEADEEVARLKASSAMVAAVEQAVRHYEVPPSRGMVVETEWADLPLTPGDWADAFDVAGAATPHDEARDEVWEELLTILETKAGDSVPAGALRGQLTQNAALRSAFTRAWPLLDPAGVLADLFSVPAYLQACAPGLTAEEVALLQRDDPRAWTLSDLPLLDAARQRIGDPTANRVRREREAVLAFEREGRNRVVDDLIAADDGEGLVTMLRGSDAQTSLIDEAALPSLDPDVLAGPFAHIVVDEAQELTDAEWRMLLRRCPSRGFTIVGDRAQARHGFTEAWSTRLAGVGIPDARVSTLSINYRTPEEIMTEAEPVIRAAIPDANVPTSVRTSGLPVVHGTRGDLAAIVAAWLSGDPAGIGCVIAADGETDAVAAVVPRSDRVRVLTPAQSKGLEFDLVVLVAPEAFGEGIAGAVDHYVAMTRSTRELVVLG